MTSKLTIAAIAAAATFTSKTYNYLDIAERSSFDTVHDRKLACESYSLAIEEARNQIGSDDVGVEIWALDIIKRMERTCSEFWQATQEVSSHE